MNLRNDWLLEEVAEIYHTPLLQLIYQAAQMHRNYHDPNEVQLCQLLSAKTGGCKENCAYCSQSIHYNTGVKPEKQMDVEKVVEMARKAQETGVTRFCIGAAWRGVRNSPDFDRIVEMVKRISAMGMEVCCTLGLLSQAQAERLKDAGLFAYNHNLDTGPSYYSSIITTRNFADRLKTLYNIREANISVCCGGIIGMGESDADRIELLHTLATFPKHPESVPINALMPVEGTPLGDLDPPTIWEFVRMIATARILMPESMVRVCAGRIYYSQAELALCFFAGGNSIFIGDTLLTEPNPEKHEDFQLLETLGLSGKQVGSLQPCKI